MPQKLIKQGVIIFAAAATLEKTVALYFEPSPAYTVNYHDGNNKKNGTILHTRSLTRYLNRLPPWSFVDE